MKIIKIGDIHRILYVAKNFQTGLTDVTGNSLSPLATLGTIAWHGSNPLSGFCELGKGIYYADWDSAAKAEGMWAFTVDSASKPAKAADTIQLVDVDTLDNTAFEKLDTMIDAIKAAVELAAPALVTIDTNVDSILSAINDGTTGLSAIHTDLATVSTNVDAIETLASGADGFAAIKAVVDSLVSAVSGISNSTKNTWVTPAEVVIPSTGSINRRVYMNIFDGSGNMEDPDSNQIQVVIESLAGVAMTTYFLAGVEPIYMTRDAVGQFHIDYAVESTDTAQDLRFKHTYLEGGLTVVRDGIVGLVDSMSSDIGSQLSAIDGKIDVLQSSVDDVELVVVAINTLVSTINANTDTIEADIAAVDVKVDTALAALTTIDTNVDDIETLVGTIDGKADILVLAVAPGGYIV